MNQPTREEYEELKRRVTRLERDTEPIKMTRTAIGSVLEDTAILKVDMASVKGNILKIRESQSDLRDTLEEHGQRINDLTQDHAVHFEVMVKTVEDSATDVKADLGKRFDKIESVQAEHRGRMDSMDRKLDTIIALLQQRRP